MRDQTEVCSLLRGVMLRIAQPLSVRLPGGLRFLHPPMPAVLSARLTARFPPVGGEQRAYHVPLVYPRGVGSSSTPGVLHLRQVTHEHLCLTPYLLVQAFGLFQSRQHLSLVLTHDACRGSHLLTLPRYPSPLTASVLAVTVSAHASAATQSGEAALSPELHTPPLPVTHVRVEYRLQKTGLCLIVSP